MQLDPYQPPPGPDRIGPTTPVERHFVVDVLRGVALLGILVINAVSIGLPEAARTNPASISQTGSFDVIVWFLMQLLFSQKFMVVFSALFGAGLVIMHIRTKAAGVTLARIYYRRIFWLMLFGLVHAYLLWSGDILYLYAVCGLLLYLFRNLSARKLIICGSVVLIGMLLLFLGIDLVSKRIRTAAMEAQTAQSAGEMISEQQEAAIVKWEKLRAALAPGVEEAVRDKEIYLGSYADIFARRLEKNPSMQTMTLPLLIWRPFGLMLIGMGLWKMGILSGKRSRRFYRYCMLLGYTVGLPIVGYGIMGLLKGAGDPFVTLRYMGIIDYCGSLLIALGHIGIVMLVCQSQSMIRLQRGLAAVGRMALTNYLVHTIVLTSIFYGYGLGFYGRIGYLNLMGLVLLIWIFQLAVSPIWLRNFRFGPLEWLWRSLTYWRWQPFRSVPR